MEQKLATESKSQVSTNQPRVALITTSLTLFFIAFMGSGLNVALPVIGSEFKADAILLNWIITSHSLTVVVFLLPFGRLADITGIKKVIIYGMSIFTVAAVLCALSSSTVMLIIFRSIQGIGGAMLYGNLTAMLSTIYPANQRGRALGINTASVYIGYSIGPFLGGLITEYFGWRFIFLIIVPATLVIIVLILWKIKGDWSESKGEKFDTFGSIIYGFGIIASMYGFSQLPQTLGAIFAGIGIICVIFFILWESQINSPILNVSLFKNNKALLLANVATLISFSSSTAVAFLMSLYLQYITALTPVQAGLILLAQPTAQALFSPLTGRLSDKVEPRIIASVGMMLSFGVLLVFSFLSKDTPLTLILVIMILLGIGLAFFGSPNTNAVMSSVAPKYFGAVASIHGTMRNIGMLMSMAITMVVMATIIGKVTITPNYYPAFLTSTRTIFIIFSIICFVGIFTSLYRGKLRRNGV